MLGWGSTSIEGTTPDHRLHELAAAQLGLVTTVQLRAIGLSDGQMLTRVRRRQLIRVERGIYTTTHGPLTPSAANAVALLACGDTAALSHLSALNLWRLLPRQLPTTQIHVTVASGEVGRKVAAVSRHRTRHLPREQVRRLDGLPLTSPERTLADCAPLLDRRDLERAIDEALARGVTSLTKLREFLAEHPAGRGRRLLSELVRDHEGPRVTKLEAEERLLRLIRAAGLPEPHTQVMLYGQSLDAYWPRARFAVEVDGRRWHTQRAKFERDRRKDQILSDHGITVSRTTWEQITREPLQLTAHIARRIALGSAQAA